MRILVVEDDADVADAIADVLAEEGFEVDIVPDGAAALGYLAGREPPSLILLDLVLPVIDGQEVRRRQKALARVRAVPVLVISARPDASKVANAMGADGCLEKPMDRDELVRAIRVCVRQVTSHVALDDVDDAGSVDRLDEKIDRGE
jgi:DNA-binding response OmpR family regulator